MELKEFITGTISEISNAISECNAELKGNATIVNPGNATVASDKNSDVYGHININPTTPARRPIHLIKFDVSVTAIDKTGTRGGVGIAVGSIGLGAQAKSEAESASFSKLTFSIPVALPVGNED